MNGWKDAQLELEERMEKERIRWRWAKGITASGGEEHRVRKWKKGGKGSVKLCGQKYMNILPWF